MLAPQFHWSDCRRAGGHNRVPERAQSGPFDINRRKKGREHRGFGPGSYFQPEPREKRFRKVSTGNEHGSGSPATLTPSLSKCRRLKEAAE